MRTLWDTYIEAFDSACEVPWRVYDSKTKKLLCEDYQKLPDTAENKWFDDLKVVSHHMRKDHLKLYVRS